MKAEGLADLPQSPPSMMTLRLVVAFDKNAKATHIPSRIQTHRVSRRDDRN